MSCPRPMYYHDIKDYRGNKVPIPCGLCLSCRIDKRILWEQRLKAEYCANSSSFVTLTYDDNHLRYSNANNYYPTTDFRQLHRYVDTLRHKVRSLSYSDSYISPNFKVFGCTEYGDSFNRPHAHLLFFGLDFSRCYKLFKTTWKNGNVKVLPLLNGGIRYVLKYLDKQQDTKELIQKKYLDHGIEPPKRLIGRNIGTDYIISQIPNLRKYGMFKVGDRFIPCPQYYKNKYLEFNDNYIDLLDTNYELRQRDLRIKAQKLGYSSVEKMLAIQTQAKEESIYKKLMNNSECAQDYLSCVHHFRRLPTMELYSLADKALDIPVNLF